MVQRQLASMNEWTAAGKGIKEVARIEFVQKIHLHCTAQLKSCQKKLELLEYCDLKSHLLVI